MHLPSFSAEVAVFIHVEERGRFKRATVGSVGCVPIQIAQPDVDGRVVVADHFHVALEDGVVGCVEADHGRVEADVGFGDVWTEEVGATVGGGLEVGFDAVEGVEEGVDGVVEGLLRCCEAAFVDAVVDVVVDP